jgi:hypothetical protein
MARLWEAAVSAVPEIRAEPAVVLAAAKLVVLDQETTPPPICHTSAVHVHAVLPAVLEAVIVPATLSVAVATQSVPATVPVF